jgi:hypothetical protein
MVFCWSCDEGPVKCYKMPSRISYTVGTVLCIRIRIQFFQKKFRSGILRFKMPHVAKIMWTLSWYLYLSTKFTLFNKDTVVFFVDDVLTFSPKLECNLFNTWSRFHIRNEDPNPNTFWSGLAALILWPIFCLVKLVILFSQNILFSLYSQAMERDNRRGTWTLRFPKLWGKWTRGEGGIRNRSCSKLLRSVLQCCGSGSGRIWKI